jgi:hypothetical protein
MKKVLFYFIVVINILAAPIAYGAPLSQRDLENTGDGLISYDEATQLEWLDLTLTVNISYDEIIGGYGNYITSVGNRGRVLIY